MTDIKTFEYAKRINGAFSVEGNNSMTLWTSFHTWLLEQETAGNLRIVNARVDYYSDKVETKKNAS